MAETATIIDAKRGKRRAYNQSPERKAVNRARKQTPEYKAWQRQYNRRYAPKRDALRYGITLEQSLALHSLQRCAICRGPLRCGKNGKHIDHDHATGKVRGVLCSECNTGIGKLREDLTIIARAVEYIARDGDLSELIDPDEWAIGVVSDFDRYMQCNCNSYPQRIAEGIRVPSDAPAGVC